MTAMSDDRVWLTHPETGGFFHCPAAAVDGWREIGWEPSDPPPPEVNPAVAHLIAQQRERETAAAQSSAAVAEPKAKPATKPATVKE